MNRLFLLVVVLFPLIALADTPKPREKLQEEFLSWKFGLFLHFNVATFNNQQWAGGYEDPATFAPTQLDCGQWADAAKAAGMKYAVLTVKHTGGWCLWPSKVTSHSVQSFTNYKNGKGDIVREFVDAFRARGIKIGFYYCAPGNYDGKYGNTLPPGKPSLHGMPPEAQGDYVGFMKKQFTELLTDYGPIELIWVDQFSNSHTGKQWGQVKDHIKSLQPNCIVIANNSHNFVQTDIYSYERPVYKAGKGLPAAGHHIPSEICDCICSGWFWDKARAEKTLRSAEDIVATVQKWNSRKANYLLNVPPDTTGRIPDSFVKRLQEVGKLLQTESTLTANPQGTGYAGAYAASKNWAPPKDPVVIKNLQQWQNQKFGLLISWQACTQWGVDSWVLSPERFSWNQRHDWITNTPSPFAKDDRAYKKAYENLITTFNPVKFDPDKWAAAAKDAGVKYVLLMSKHCDGFNMYATKFSDYGITSPRCPFNANSKADVFKAQADAFRGQGIRIGLYASKCDWANPDYWAPDFPLNTRGTNYDTRKHPDRWARYKKFFWNQMEELTTGYGPLDILWLDDGWVRAPHEDLDITGMAVMARKHQPGLIVVDRTIKGPNENYITPEGGRAMPSAFLPYPWEICDPIGKHWNYFPNDQYKSAGTLIRNLCRIVARNGNYLLGVGPDASGEFDPTVYARLKEMGTWLKLNGEAIYDTRPIKPYEQGNCVFTRTADGTVYAIVLSEKDGQAMPSKIELPSSLACKAKSITLVGSDGPALKARHAQKGIIVVDIPPDVQAKPPCADAWVLKIVK